VNDNRGGLSGGLLPIPSNAPGAPPPAVVAIPVAINWQGGGQPAGPDWRRTFAALWRYRWLIGVTTLVGALVGIFAGQLMHPIYQAQATIWIDQGDPRNPGPAWAARGDRLLGENAWSDLLTSFAVLENAVRSQRLYLSLDHPRDASAFANFDVTPDLRPGGYRLDVDGSGRAYTLATAEGAPLERGKLGGAVGAREGFAWTPVPSSLPAGHSILFTVSTPREAAEHLAAGLEVAQDEAGSFIKVGLKGPNPRSLAATLNAVTQRFVDVADTLKRQRLTEVRKITEEQLAEAQDNLSRAEGALQDFQIRTTTLPGGGTGAGRGNDAMVGDQASSGFFSMQVDREQLVQDKAALGRYLVSGAGRPDSTPDAQMLQAIPSAIKTPGLAQALDTLSAKQAALRSMAYQFTDAYPPKKRLAGEVAQLERGTLPDLVRGVMRDDDARIAALDAQLGQQASVLKQVPPRLIEAARLQRAVNIANDLYTSLEQRYQEAHLSENAAVADVRVLDLAVAPEHPLKNTAPGLLLLGLMGGLGLGLVGAVILDRMDGRMRRAEEVSGDLGLSILGTVPHLNRSHTRKVRGPESIETIEALRGLRVTLLSAFDRVGAMALTITSPGPGDGKSFISSNLALACVASGLRTVLIDADLRRGTLFRQIAAEKGPGLADYLRGKATYDRIMQATSFPSLTFVARGTRGNDSPELLESSAMKHLIDDLKSRYDVVICDSPPLGAGVDSTLLGGVTGSLLLVVRAGRSARSVAQTSLEMLRRLPIRLLGAVINDVPQGAAYRYYPYALEYGVEAEPESEDSDRVQLV
jgi:tyrosine-protein kinase Etk/Wzc